MEKTEIKDALDFDVFLSEDPESHAIVVTSTDIEGLELQELANSFKKYKENNQYSTVLSDKPGTDTLTSSRINELSQTINSDVNSLITANSFIRQYSLTDDSIGKAVESIYSNINSDYKLSYRKIEGRNKTKKLQEAQRLIEDFNDQIDLKNFIRDAVTSAYFEGTKIYYMRNSEGNYTVDSYPLGVVEISDWEIGGKPICTIDLTKLRQRLQKVYKKTKKNKPLFFKDINEEVEQTFPKEVVTAFSSGESLAKLDADRSGVLRIMNFGKKYGVSPIFKSLKSAVILDSIENKDIVNNKAKSRKIIHQLLRKELLGSDYTKKGFVEAAHAHNELMMALKNQTAVYTSAPFVEKIYYVEPTVDDTPANKIALYRSRILAALGISFTDSDISNLTISKISVDQLMRVINSIGEQLETIIERWYKIILAEAGFQDEYAPKIKIIDSEVLEYSLKKDICSFLYSTLNCSLQTAFEMFDIDIEDEKQRRISENNDHLDNDIFYPRATSYTTPANGNTGGRPKEENPVNPQKQETDNIYNDIAR